ncbi:hypothetical protein BDF22DRAFT_327098 [Syncephalis plumigaleata]|nr:hypothetical protein BDF22DRAFT_327098 [Syncephalis plumigaleata]
MASSNQDRSLYSTDTSTADIDGVPPSQAAAASSANIAQNIRLPTRQSSPAALRYAATVPLFKDIPSTPNGAREKVLPSQIVAQFHESLNSALIGVNTTVEDKLYRLLKTICQLFHCDAGWAVYWDANLLSLPNVADQILTDSDSFAMNAEQEAGLGLHLNDTSEQSTSDKPDYGVFPTLDNTADEGVEKKNEDSSAMDPAKDGIRLIQIYGGTSVAPLRRQDLIQSFVNVYRYVSGAEPTIIEHLSVSTQTAVLCIPFLRNDRPFSALCLRARVPPTCLSRILSMLPPTPVTSSPPYVQPHFLVYRHNIHTMLSLLGGRMTTSTNGIISATTPSQVSSASTSAQLASPGGYYLNDSMLTSIGSYYLQYAASCISHVLERYVQETYSKNELARSMIVNRMFRAINAHMEPDQILATTAKTICRAFKADRCMIIHFAEPDDPHQLLDYKSSVVAEYRSHDHVPMILKQQFGMDVYVMMKKPDSMQQKANSGRRSSSSMIFNDALHNPHLVHVLDHLNELHIRSSMSIRTKNSANEYNGLVGVHQCSYARAFTNADLALLEILGAHVGGALSQRVQNPTKCRATVPTAEEEAAQKREQEFVEKTMLFSNVVHELRTPLNGVLGFVDLLRETELTPIQQEHCRDIRSGGEMLLRLVNQMLDLSKVQSNTMDFQLINCSVHGIIDETLRLLSPMARQKSLELVPLIAADCPSMILTDDFRVRQILGNLLSNAIKFSPEDTVIIIRVTLLKSVIHADTVMGDYHDVISSETNKRGPHAFRDSARRQLSSDTASDYHVGKPVTLEFSIEDQGLGIPKNAQPLLFRRFMQLSDSKHRTSGSGLGLAICKEMARNMGGDIWLASSIPNQGSTFKFTINVAELERVDDHGLMSPSLTINTPSTLSPPASEAAQTTLSHHGSKVDLTIEQILKECLGKSSKEVHNDLLERIVWFLPSDYEDTAQETTLPASLNTLLPNPISKKTPSIDDDQQSTLYLRLLPIGTSPNDQPLFSIEHETLVEWTTLDVVKPPRQNEITKCILKWLRIVRLHRHLQQSRKLDKLKRKRAYDDNSMHEQEDEHLSEALVAPIPITPHPSSGGLSEPITDKGHASGQYYNDNDSGFHQAKDRNNSDNIVPMQDIISTSNENDDDGDDDGTKEVVRDKRSRSSTSQDRTQEQATKSDKEMSLRQEQVILVVEDNPLNAKLMCHIIKNFGYRAEHASSGEEALSLTMEKNYALIFMDYQLPGMDGCQSANKIRQQCVLNGRPRMPIIALTGMSGDRIRERCHEYGIDDYLTKPVVKHTLYEVLNQWCCNDNNHNNGSSSSSNK